jgi:hypothetical protein
MRVNFKELKEKAIKHSEQVGLGVGIGLLLVLTVMGLFLKTPSGPTPTDLSQAEQSAQRAIDNAQYIDDKKAGELTPKQLRLSSQASRERIHGDVFSLNRDFKWATNPDERGKRNPLVMVPNDLKATPLWLAFRQYDIKPPLAQVVKVTSESVKLKATESKTAPRNLDSLLKRYELANQRRPTNQPPKVGPNQGGNPEPKPEETTTIVWKSEGLWKPTEEITQADVLAERLVPARGVLVTGLFPHGEQMREIARALKIEDQKVNLYYDRLEIQRREIDAGGKAGDWVLLDHNHVNWRKSLALLGTATQFKGETDTHFLQLCLEGITWEELPEVQRLTYLDPKDGKTLLESAGFPDPLKLHTKLEETYTALKNKNITHQPVRDVTPDPRLKADDFNPAGRRKPTAADTGNTGTKASDSGAAPTKPISSETKPVEGAPMTTPAVPEVSWPEFCLLRFVDLDPTILPGRTYEYRVRMILQNPNHGKTDVINPGLAKAKYLPDPQDTEAGWSGPSRVTFPHELFFYAGSRDSHRQILDKWELPKPTMMDEKNRVVMEVHKWLDFALKPGSGGEDWSVGDWWVDHELVGRGEYIGRAAEKPLIVWLPIGYDGVLDQANKMTVTRAGTDSFQPRLQVANLATDPGNPRSRALLVDFEGGQSQRHFWGPPNFRYVDEQASSEILMVDPNGKLIARRSVADQGNEQRMLVFQRWDKWADQTKNLIEKVKKAGTADKPKTVDFDKPK